MPKRNREDQVKAAPLSALAARRLHSQDAAPKTPETEEKPLKAIPASNGSPSPFTITTSTSTNYESESIEDIAAKRREIESKLREQVKAQTKIRSGLQYGNTSLEESAFARVRMRKSGEAEDLALAQALDEEMVDMGLRSDDEVMAAHDDTARALVDLGNGEESSRPRLMQVSTFAPTGSNYTHNIENNTSIFRMVIGESLVILGEYQLKVTKGTITLFGATLTKLSGKHVVYAPSTHSLPVIECVEGNGEKSDEFNAEVAITSQNSNSGLREVGKLCPMFNSIWVPSGTRQSDKEEAYFPIYSTTYNLSTLSIPKPWELCLETLIGKTNSALTSFSTTLPPAILITGSKGTGKSTFARTLVNKFLTSPISNCTSVVYLDVDPGQPEFSPPGFISLHRLTSPILGPPFTHPNPPTILRSHHIGFTSPREDPAHYISCIINLITHYRELLASATTVEETRTPIIVNTAGWTKGLGLELLSDIILQCQASDVVFLSGALERTNHVTEIVPESIRLHELESSSSGPARFSAADLRMLMTMSYLHHDPAKGKWDFETPLTAVPPWVVPYSGSEPGVDAIVVLGEHIVPEELMTATDGTLVGVVVVDGDLADFGTLVHTSGTNLPYLIDAPPLSPETSFAAGLALIRGIDAENGCLHLLTSIREEEVERWDREGLKVVLVRGRLELSVWEMVGAGVEAPWISVGAMVGADGKGAEVWKVRRNVMRRGQQAGST